MNTSESANIPHGEGKHIALVTMGVKLGDEKRGYTRFRFLSGLLVAHGYKVDLITSSFQHWDKKQRDCSKSCYQNHPYKIIFIEEPGYTRNLDLSRIKSHAKAAKNLGNYLKASGSTYDLIYCEIPPNDVARVCAEYAYEQNIPFVADINDLWPEAMRMVMDVPFLSDVAFYPFTRDAKRVYTLLSGAVGTSDEYAARPKKDRAKPYLQETVYVGNDIVAFDAGALLHHSEILKPEGELWVSYAGTLGASYDLSTLIEAAAFLAEKRVDHPDTPLIKVKILGDGPDKDSLEALACKLNAPVDFLGYMDYEHMAAYLCASDILINSLVKAAPQSIVTKIGDYLASGKPMINTGSNKEFRKKVLADGFGINVEAQNAQALAETIFAMAHRTSQRKIMGCKARFVAEREFDQAHAYENISRLINSLLL